VKLKKDFTLMKLKKDFIGQAGQETRVDLRRILFSFPSPIYILIPKPMLGNARLNTLTIWGQ